jgi:hypothetical protein
MNRFDRQMSLFSNPSEKGSSEWSAFGGIREDRSGMFRVREPEPQKRFSVTTLKRPARPQSLFFKRGTQQ